MDYYEFLKQKQITTPVCGFDIEKRILNAKAFDWQKDIVAWALKKGKAALFEDCGLGKSIQQLMWADAVAQHTGGKILIVAPLAVAGQTVREGNKFGYHVNYCRSQDAATALLNITNYEMLENFDASQFVGVVLDESSILKNFSSRTKIALIEMFRSTPYKLCCTATPSPNDFTELGNHAEFLGIMSRAEMLATFFVHDGGSTKDWRLKGHATEKFFEWVASWACCMTSPADLGYDDAGYNLPPLNIIQDTVKSNNMVDADGQQLLFAQATQTLSERRKVRRESLQGRCKTAADIANSMSEQMLIWCDLNDESHELKKLIPDAVEVCGADSPDFKRQSMLDFTDGKARVLISKPSLCGFGMNWQNCHNVIFAGLSDSFEAYYQAVRRCWRFGQVMPVDVHVITSEAEGAVKANIQRKQENAQHMTHELVKYTKAILQADIHQTTRITENYVASDKMETPAWLGGAA
ncbi:MAG: helicase [Ruminococcaceae bacterium]|nr:helicase [Oscillospiraceae bacterium]